jgi:hypothetical protein
MQHESSAKEIQHPESLRLGPREHKSDVIVSHVHMDHIILVVLDGIGSDNRLRDPRMQNKIEAKKATWPQMEEEEPQISEGIRES